MHIRSSALLFSTAIFIVLMAGCGKPHPATPPADQSNSVRSAPTDIAATTPTPNESSSSASANQAPTMAAGGIVVDSTKGAGDTLDWAVKQDAIKHDPLGQWASNATASSTWNDNSGQADFTPWQATGAPNVDQEGDSANAWSPKTPDSGIEWLDLTFPNAVAATGLRIRESLNAGTLVKVELFDAQGNSHVIWTGTDPTRGLNYLMFTFPKTAYQTNHVKLTLSTNLIPGLNEIDAIQLLGTPN